MSGTEINSNVHVLFTLLPTMTKILGILKGGDGMMEDTWGWDIYEAGTVASRLWIITLTFSAHHTIPGA